MEGWLNVTKSIGDDVFVRWLRQGSLPMMRRKNLEVADRLVEVFQFVMGR